MADLFLLSQVQCAGLSGIFRGRMASREWTTVGS